MSAGGPLHLFVFFLCAHLYCKMLSLTCFCSQREPWSTAVSLTSSVLWPFWRLLISFLICLMIFFLIWTYFQEANCRSSDRLLGSQFTCLLHFYPQELSAQTPVKWNILLNVVFTFGTKSRVSVFSLWTVLQFTTISQMVAVLWLIHILPFTQLNITFKVPWNTG